MSSFPSTLIDQMGGTAAVSRMACAPMSTVHAWRRTLSDSRLDHLRRIIADEKLPVDMGALAESFGVALPDAFEMAEPSSGTSTDLSQQVAA